MTAPWDPPPPSPPGLDDPGRWRCCLCRGRYSRWRRGTLRDAHDHYLAMHHRAAS